jgi:actin-related protein
MHAAVPAMCKSSAATDQNGVSDDLQEHPPDSAQERRSQGSRESAATDEDAISEDSMSDFQVVVIDNGLASIKAGIAGDEAPRVVVPRSLRDQAPANGGAITDWSEMEQVWRHLFADELRVDPKGCGVLMTAPPGRSNTDWENMARIMFEKFGVEAFYIADPAVLTLYASGRTDGIVVDVGEYAARIVPVCQGFAVPGASQQLDVGGWHLTRYLGKILDEKGCSFGTTPEAHKIVRGVKEACSYVAPNFEAELLDGGEAITHRLPSGQVITLGSERFRCPEPLFQPALLGVEAPGIHQLTAKAINACDRFVRREVANAIVLTGGSSMIERLEERLQNDVAALMTGMDVKVFASPERRYAAWIGGSILASLSSFDAMWMRSSDYAEQGAAAVHRFCAPLA